MEVAHSFRARPDVSLYQSDAKGLCIGSWLTVQVHVSGWLSHFHVGAVVAFGFFYLDHLKCLGGSGWFDWDTWFELAPIDSSWFSLILVGFHWFLLGLLSLVGCC